MGFVGSHFWWVLLLSTARPRVTRWLYAQRIVSAQFITSLVGMISLGVGLIRPLESDRINLPFHLHPSCATVVVARLDGMCVTEQPRYPIIVVVASVCLQYYS